mgnify:CR=1 FL=1
MIYLFLNLQKTLAPEHNRINSMVFYFKVNELLVILFIYLSI